MANAARFWYGLFSGLPLVSIHTPFSGEPFLHSRSRVGVCAKAYVESPMKFFRGESSRKPVRVALAALALACCAVAIVAIGSIGAAAAPPEGGPPRYST